MVATSGCRTGLLLVAVLATAAWTAGAGRHDPFQSLEQAGSRRSLLQYPLFPYWGCQTYACACSPYNIQLTSVTQVPGQRTPTAQQTCFSVSYKGCDDSLPCCTALKDKVHKIGIRTTEACVRANIVGVTLNNRTHVSWNTYRYVVGTGFGYMVKIYDLQRNATTFPGTEVCITTVRGCESLTALCDTASGGQCTTVVSESPLHDYCPICSAGSLDDSPPPTASSPPPSPSPAQPPSPLPPSPATPSVPLAPPPPSPATPALPLAPPPVSAPSPSYPAIPNSPAPPSPAPSSSPSPSPTRSPAPQTPQPSPAYPAPSPSPSTVPVPSYPAPSPAVYPTIPLPSPGSPPVAPPPAYPSIPLPSPPYPAAPAYPGFPLFPSPAAPAYPSPVSSPSPSSPDLPTPSPVTPPTGCIACVTLVRFASPFSQDECDLLAMTATQLYVTQYDDTILGPDGQPAAFTCSELGSRPDTDVRFMQNFVTACAALADQAMVDELYFNINAESDILALAYYEPFSLSCNIPAGQTQPIFPSDSVTFDNTCDSTERMFRPQCFRQRDPVAPSAPPPPSPSRLFPEHTCRTNQATPFTLDARLPAVPTERGSKYCFNVTTTPCADPASTCCQNALLTKVEMEIDYNLRRQVLWVWVNDDRRARSWGSSNSNVLKIAPLSLTTDLAASTTNTVCVELATGTSLEEACMGPACNYALFVDGGCCQLGQQTI